MDKSAKIYVAGHTGLVGSALLRLLTAKGYKNLITQTVSQLDLRNQQTVHSFFEKERPEYVFLAAAKVGGIKANVDFPASFVYDNLMIEANIIDAAYRCDVTKLLFLGSSCIYPKFCPQPIKEEYLLTGMLESTNKPYAIAKIAGIELCQSYNRQYGTSFISCMPTNLYGPGDTFDLNNSHVIPALIKKFHDAKINNHQEVVIWGTGSPRREFLHVDDLADALIFLMNRYNDNQPINIGCAQDISIKELAYLLKDITHYEGTIKFDTTYPDGTPQKLLDITKLTNLGWFATISLREGLASTYSWYCSYQNTHKNFRALSPSA